MNEFHYQLPKVIDPLSNSIYLLNNYNLELIARSEFYYNSNAPNFENMGNRFIGKGVGIFSSIKLSYSSKYVIFSLEPFYMNSQNEKIKIKSN